MGKKRKLESNFTNKSSPIEVTAENLENNPLCLHGHTLLFSSDKSRYFSCSSCRNKRDCTVHITEEDWQNDNVKKRNQKYLNLIPKIDKKSSWDTFNKVKSEQPYNRAYCVTCEDLFIPSQVKRHNKDHRVITPLTDIQLTQPSTWLPALENDTVEAQYLFSRKTTETILSVLKKNKIGNILCIGTPSIHEAAQSRPEFDSLLLDYDKRHHQFWQPEKFIWYNMFNNFLFNGEEDEQLLKKFFKSSRETGLCVVMDPPFGGRVEPLVYVLQQLNIMYQTQSQKQGALPVVWAFPYFSEPYIRNTMPEMLMHDFQVEYENHKKFQNKNKKGRKFGSAVRLFTNFPLATIDLSSDKNYKLCQKCKYWVAVSNKHCFKCGTCSSKNGMTYQHCGTCKICVKPTFFHCNTCKRCCQQKDHVCGVVVESQSCFNCKQKGHKKIMCPQLQESTNGPVQKKKKNNILIV